MSASSVTGVGTGSALKEGTRGPDTMFMGVEKLIGPRVVRAGTVTLSGGTATVTFPADLSGVAADYIVLAGGAAAHSYASSVAVSGFTMNGTGSQVVSYAVIRVNNATVEVN